jgi:protein ImuA
MTAVNANIIAQLQKEILSLQGLKKSNNTSDIDFQLGEITRAFPNESFPLSAVHEFVNMNREHQAATSGFISYLVSSLMKNGSAAVWISSSPVIFPPALRSFGISPDKIIFVSAKDHKEILWVMEEALQCEGLAAVIAEIRDLNFTESRRLQLAVEKDHVTGFIIRDQPARLTVNACVSRWKISSLKSKAPDGLPGIGSPRWNIELLKIRNGKPGTWQAFLNNGILQFENTLMHHEIEKRKAV